MKVPFGALDLASSWCYDGVMMVKQKLGNLKQFISFSQLRTLIQTVLLRFVHYIFLDRPLDANDTPLHDRFACLLRLGS
jgi:hypothetical protein